MRRRRGAGARGVTQRSGAGPRDEERARALILRYGWNATAYQLLNPGITHWFSSAGDALVGYATYAGTRVVAGAPVCSAARLEQVIAEFREDAARDHRRICFFGAGSRLERLLTSQGHWSVASLGAQPSWDPASWPAIVARRSSLRAQLNRARNHGVRVEEWPDVGAARERALRECLGEWLEGRGLPALHFLVEPETLGRLEDRRLFAATREGMLVGFLLASPVPARSGWLVEQIIRRRSAPNGTAELLLDHAMRGLHAGGARYVTLGLSPLSAHSAFDRRRMVGWLRLALRLVRAHGRRFYDFEGLDRFKQKFEPEDWEEIVALAPGRRFPVRALWAIAGVFSQGSPIVLVARAVGKAVRQELAWARGGRRSVR
jgi:phosphatidylglycerol lysyltransferase